MVNNNNQNNWVPPKEWTPNIPKTVTISYYYPEGETNHSPLIQDGSYRSWKANANYPSYGPCPYSGCPYDTAFWMEIFIEGNSRNWARKPSAGTFLPGEWEWSPLTSNYRYREDLWLTDVDQARRVHPLLGNIDEVYAVNFWGKHCAEDVKFCNSARAVIQRAVDCHERGDRIKEKITIDSDIAKWSRFAFKAGAAVGASFINPVAGVAIGATAWGAGQVGQVACDSDRGKAFWGTVGGIGEDTIKGLAVGQVVGTVNNVNNLLVNSSVVSLAYKVYNKHGVLVDLGIEAGWKHSKHLRDGWNYDRDCPVCNFPGKQ